MVTIEEVNSKYLRKIFVGLSTNLYKNNASWVRPLDTVINDAIDFRHNPFYENGFGKAYLAKKDDKYIGRILAHISKRHHKLHNEKICYFGFFESIHDNKVAAALFKAVEYFASSNSCNIIRGPFNLNAAQEIGFITNGFENIPAIDMVYTQPYYPDILKDNGFSICYNMKTWKNINITNLPIQNKLKAKTDVTTRSLKFWSRFDDFENIRELVNSAFLGNWGFVPITQAEWKLQVGALIPFLDPNLIIIAEHKGIPVGVTFAIPDYNKIIKRVKGKIFHPLILRLLLPNILKSAVVILFAVRKQFQNMGISHVLNKQLIKNLQKKNYKDLAVTWVADNNLGSLSQIKLLGMTPLHHLAMFEKIL